MGYRQLIRFLEKRYKEIFYISTIIIVISALIFDKFYELLYIVQKEKLIAVLIAALILLIIPIFIKLSKIYRSIEETVPEEGHSGIIRVYPEFNKNKFKKIVSNNNTVILVNTFIVNFNDLKRILTKAVLNNSSIEIYELSLDSDHIKQRGKELSESMEANIEMIHDKIRGFVNKLPEVKRNNITVYSYDYPPKCAIYGTTKSALVSLYWVHTQAVDSTSFLIENHHGYFSNDVWNHFLELKATRSDITQEVITKKNISSS